MAWPAQALAIRHCELFIAWQQKYRGSITTKHTPYQILSNFYHIFQKSCIYSYNYTVSYDPVTLRTNSTNWNSIQVLTLFLYVLFQTNRFVEIFEFLIIGNFCCLFLKRYCLKKKLTWVKVYNFKELTLTRDIFLRNPILNLKIGSVSFFLFVSLLMSTFWLWANIAWSVKIYLGFF